MVLTFLLGLALQAQTGPLGAYEAVLREIRQSFPGSEVVLSTRLFGASDPPEGVMVDGGALPGEWIQEITAKGLVERTCTPAPQTIGCASPSPSGAKTVVVLVGPLHRTAHGSEADVWIIPSPSAGRPDRASIQRYTYTLTSAPQGWSVASVELRAVS